MKQQLQAVRRVIGPLEIGVLAFTAVYMFPAVMTSWRGGNSEFLMYVAVMGILLPIVLWLHAVVHLHPASLCGLSLWGLAHMSGGLLHIPQSWVAEGATPVLYNWWILPGLLKFDQLVHACGFGLCTWICWQALQAAFARRGAGVSPTFGLLFLCVLAGNGLGALNEVVEFTATLTVPNTNVGGYENTGWDMVSNLVGTLLAALLIAVLTPRPPVGEPQN